MLNRPNQADEDDESQDIDDIRSTVNRIYPC